VKIFSCSACEQVLFFENVSCTRCGRVLAYLPEHSILSALERAPDQAADTPASEATFVALAPAAKGARYRLCRNYTLHAACSWAVPAASSDAFCRACAFDQVIPELADPVAHEAWQHIERAKRRLLYTLFELGLPLETKAASARGLAFAFKQDAAGEKVFTGHSDGLVTLNIAEADDPFREKLRLQLGETYRTLLGHFRHEIGHYYWWRLVDGSRFEAACRDLFGDERTDYAAALQRHYDQGPPADWPERFVSAYASMHPSEDWAETWAHYLHMVDTLETARSYGLVLRPRPVGGGAAELGDVRARRLDFDDFDDLIGAWVPLTVALNSLNRSMGLADAYPFVLTRQAITKLRFVHDVIEAVKAGEMSGAGAATS
jgi:hypothetical protein